ncbi:hypothetical protein, partial [Mesorhizobium sp. M7A.F.Ca.CA.002.05.1.1]|uniref:hypothetical protein n=1 Tax=Mesorhizobium sp. M7A.F.Ca.CA.002.05.1.1 TaxID=2496704 RepID=UPI0019D1F396
VEQLQDLADFGCFHARRARSQQIHKGHDTPPQTLQYRSTWLTYIPSWPRIEVCLNDFPNAPARAHCSNAASSSTKNVQRFPSA